MKELNAEATAPERPIATAVRTSAVPCRICRHAPDIDVGAITNREVAVEARMGSRNTRLRIGIIMVPPPIPNIPERIPTITPKQIVRINKKAVIRQRQNQGRQ
jgi:hypothetical protein